MTKIKLITSDAEAQDLRDRLQKEAEAGRDPMECPPIIGENGSLTWETVEEVKHGRRVRRRRRLDD